MTKSTVKPKIDKSGTVTFELTLSKELISASYQKNLKKIADGVELKGFRKGKAPLDMVEGTLDKSRVYNQVLDDVIPRAYLEQIKSSKLIPIIEPRVTPLSMEKGKDWNFKVELAVMPEFELGDYQETIKTALVQHSKVHKHQEGESKDQKHNHELEIIFDALLKQIDFTPSPLLVEAESKAALSRLVQELSSLGLKVADYAKSQKKTEQELVEEYSKNAAVRLRLELILQKLQVELKDKVKNRQELLDFLLKL